MDLKSIEWDIAFALRHKSPAKLRRDTSFDVVASAVADHLRLAGWEFTRQPPAPAPSTTRFMWPETDPAPSEPPPPAPSPKPSET